LVDFAWRKKPRADPAAVEKLPLVEERLLGLDGGALPESVTGTFSSYPVLEV
jgi:hypothetical protein